MKKLKLILIAGFAVFLALPGITQTVSGYKSWNPASSGFPVLEGQAWPQQVKDFYDRLPAKAESTVRKAVWELSKNSAGLKLRFISDAKEIIIKYRVTGGLQMPLLNIRAV